MLKEQVKIENIILIKVRNLHSLLNLLIKQLKIQVINLTHEKMSIKLLKKLTNYPAKL